MKVYKFGGASVRDSAGIRNLGVIVSREKEDLVVVVSAFGKTTNALENVLRQWFGKDDGYRESLDNIYRYHLMVAGDLFGGDDNVRNKINNSFARLTEYLRSPAGNTYDFEYDQVVSFGEVWSTIIVSSYLSALNLNPEWVDIRGVLITDDRYRDANILWNESKARVNGTFSFKGTRLYVTQGFIASTAAGQTTTLGREGSDYTAAVLANMLDADIIVVWKDVPGLLNADPKWISNARKLDEVSYREAVEMTFSGAKVIHPKTIKPLHNKNIPLQVRSFIFPEESGTLITADVKVRETIPVFVRKQGQILISVLPKDFSFAMGDNLSMVFYLFARHGIKVNVVEASAISINVCIDDDRARVESLMDDLRAEFDIIYNDNLEILSVRHYNQEAVDMITKGREILLEQRTRSTVRYVVRNVPSGDE